MKVVFPQPVGPTMAVFVPASAWKLKPSMRLLLLSYENAMSFITTLPPWFSNTASLSFCSGSASISSKTLAAQARAF